MLKRNILKTLLFTPGTGGRWGLPILLEGEPGTGKTSEINAATTSLGLSGVTIIASLREPADFLGLPIPEVNGDERTKVRYAPPEWALQAADAERAVVFLDEINTAPPAVQSALLRVVLEGAVGEFKLPDTVRFVAAQNATEDAAGGWDLAAPLANRFGHFAWAPPSADQWADWLVGGAGEEEVEESDPAALEARVRELWPTPWAKACGLVSSFIRRKTDQIHKMPSKEGQSASKAWPSPRSWEMATRAIAGAEIHGLPREDRDDLVAAFVGPGAAKEFLAFQRMADLPDPREVLDGEVEVKHDKNRLDRTVAVLSSCAAYVAPKEVDKRTERADHLWTVISDVMPHGKDIVFPASRSLIKAGLGGAVCPASRKVLHEMSDVINEAGLRG